MFKWKDYEKRSRCFVDGINEHEIANIDINKMVLTDYITGKKFTLEDISLSDGKLSSEQILLNHWSETRKLIDKAMQGSK